MITVGPTDMSGEKLRGPSMIGNGCIYLNLFVPKVHILKKKPLQIYCCLCVILLRYFDLHCFIYGNTFDERFVSSR